MPPLDLVRDAGPPVLVHNLYALGVTFYRMLTGALPLAAAERPNLT